MLTHVESLTPINWIRPSASRAGLAVATLGGDVTMSVTRIVRSAVERPAWAEVPGYGD